MADTLPMPTAARLFLPLFLALGSSLHAQVQSQSDPKALAAVRAAVASQLEADRNDHSNWIYMLNDNSPEHSGIYRCAGSPQGEVRLLVERNGHPVSPAMTQSEYERIERYINDPDEQVRNKKNQAHDDAQATGLLQMLPTAFIWTIASDTPELLTLNYRPDPSFDGPDMQSKVMALMAGQLVIVHKGNLIKSFTGKLTEEFRIAFGLVGHLNKGGTIDIERKDVGGGHWEIVETHVHIGGHALFFKTIGTQQDEVKTDWKPSPAKTLHEAARILGAEQ